MQVRVAEGDIILEYLEDSLFRDAAHCNSACAIMPNV